MKKRMKWTVLLIFVCLLLPFAGCGNSSNQKVGQVVAYGGDPLMFELACNDGSNVGFVIDEETELVWNVTPPENSWMDIREGWNVFGCGLHVTVIPGEKTESADEYVDECVEGWYVAKKVMVDSFGDIFTAVAMKPVIYLYPEEEMKIDVKLNYSGKLTCTYPLYKDGWNITARPDGILLDDSGMEYNYLYWEGQSEAEYDFSKGFCVAGGDTAAFLENALEKLGFTRREANEFIVFWLPMMEPNAYNLISFQKEAYTESAELSVSPAPDTEIRVFMAWKALDAPLEIEPQELKAPPRTGFTLVEWGGTEVE